MNEAQYLKSEEQSIRKIARKRIKEINALTCPTCPKVVLDLGSNWGFYLDEYRKAGWTAWGIERGDEYPDDGFTFKADINSFKWEILRTKVPDGFDVISAYCILEHLAIDDFYSLLPTLSTLLKQDGLLVIKVPYCKGLTGRFAPEKYYLDPNHLIELGENTFWIEILEKCYGMKLVKTVIEGVHPSRVFPRLGKTWIAKWLTEKLGMGDSRCWFFRKGDY